MKADYPLPHGQGQSAAGPADVGGLTIHPGGDTSTPFISSHRLLACRCFPAAVALLWLLHFPAAHAAGAARPRAGRPALPLREEAAAHRARQSGTLLSPRCRAREASPGISPCSAAACSSAACSGGPRERLNRIVRFTGDDRVQALRRPAGDAAGAAFRRARCRQGRGDDALRHRQHLRQNRATRLRPPAARRPQPLRRPATAVARRRPGATVKAMKAGRPVLLSSGHGSAQGMRSSRPSSSPAWTITGLSRLSPSPAPPSCRA